MKTQKKGRILGKNLIKRIMESFSPKNGNGFDNETYQRIESKKVITKKETQERPCRQFESFRIF